MEVPTFAEPVEPFPKVTQVPHDAVSQGQPAFQHLSAFYEGIGFMVQGDAR